MATNTIRFINEKEAQVSKSFANKAVIFKTEEYHLWREYLAEYPNAKMVTTKIKKNPNKDNPYKGLTYASMEKYINSFDNAAELLKQFEAKKKIVEAQADVASKSRYSYVKTLFETQFPNYKNVPDFEDLKFATNVSSASDEVETENPQNVSNIERA